jgi:uncharacterized protein
MLLTGQDLLNFQRCERQVFLDIYGDRQHKAPPSDFLQKLRVDHHQFQREVLADEHYVCPQYPAQDWSAGAEATLELMRQGVPQIQGGVLRHQASQDLIYISTPDLLTKVSGVSIWGDWLYIPTDIKLSKRPKLDYQILVTFHAYLLAMLQGTWPEAYLYLRQKGRYRVELPRTRPKLEGLLTNLAHLLRHGQEPGVFIVNNRCNLCGWYPHCYHVARTQEHLSLLPGVTPSRYPILQALNFTTVEALAAASPRELQQLTGFALEIATRLVNQAKATLTNQPIPLARLGATAGSALLPTAPIELYFDIEAEPSLNLAYLHGVLVVNRYTQSHQFYPLLAECPEDEPRIWQQFLDLVLAYPTAPIFHFCPYEVQTVIRLAKYYATPDQVVQPLIARFVDLHAWVTQTVTLPIESYTLKLIARWLGFQWRNTKANGAQSICWYSQWLETGDRQFLQTIVHYNEDDCRATHHVKDWLADFLAEQVRYSA